MDRILFNWKVERKAKPNNKTSWILITQRITVNKYYLNKRKFKNPQLLKINRFFGLQSPICNDKLVQPDKIKNWQNAEFSGYPLIAK